MSKFNKTTATPARGNGPITTAGAATAATFEGGAGWLRDPRGELFLLAVSNLIGEDTFYESAADRDERYRNLVHRMAVIDPGWTARMLVWLRSVANLRSAPMVGAVEFIKARMEAKADPFVAGLLLGSDDTRGIDRALIDLVLQRADEPGEALAYWWQRFGRSLPSSFKRGLGDALMRLFAEFRLLKYDTPTHGVRWGDLLELCHPGDRKRSSQGGRWRGAWQGDLFEHAIDRRHNRANPTPETLTLIRANAALREIAGGDPQAMLDTDRLRAAGMTWEDVLSLVGKKVDKRLLWEALIPVMGVFALARNLRNFDQAGVCDTVADQVITQMSDPVQVAKSRMMPFRWLSAYLEAPSLRWGHALDLALQASLSNVPAFGGRTLVLVDTSGSMTGRTLSAKSKVTPLMAGAVFGVALAAKGEQVDLYGFANYAFEHKVPAGASLIREVQRLCDRQGEAGHGTAIAESLRATFRGHDRVVIVSDMQTMDSGVSNAVPIGTPMYGFNLGGYRVTAIDAGSANRIELGGMTDATFQLIPLIEAGRRADWDTIFTG